MPRAPHLRSNARPGTIPPSGTPWPPSRTSAKRPWNRLSANAKRTAPTRIYTISPGGWTATWSTSARWRIWPAPAPSTASMPTEGRSSKASKRCSGMPALPKTNGPAAKWGCSAARTRGWRPRHYPKRPNGRKWSAWTRNKLPSASIYRPIPLKTTKRSSAGFGSSLRPR